MTTPIWAIEGVELDSTGDSVADRLADRILSIQSVIGTGNVHVPKFTGDIHYVEPGGDNGNDGASPDTAFLTVVYAISQAAAGDAITVGAGTYDEDGMDLGLNGLELWCEIGTIFQNTAAATVLTVSGNDCRVTGLRTSQAGQVGFHVTGSRCVFEWCRATGSPTVGFDIDGGSVTILDGWVGQPTTTGYDVGVNGAKLIRCHATGTGGASRGFYVSAGLRAHVLYCTSIDNGTAGFETAVGADGHLFLDCASGGGDGDRVDAGVDNFWPGFVDRMRRQNHEHTYPESDGEGTAGDPVTVSNSTTDDAGGARDDQDYWGDTAVVVGVGVLTDSWTCLGLYMSAGTANDSRMTSSTLRNANETPSTVARKRCSRR